MVVAAVGSRRLYQYNDITLYRMGVATIQGGWNLQAEWKIQGVATREGGTCWKEIRDRTTAASYVLEGGT